MRRSILFAAFALITATVFPQFTGWNVKTGMNVSNWTDEEMNAKIGFKIGVGTEYAFNDMWSLQPSLFFSTKGAKVDSKLFNELSDYQMKMSVNQMYLELPIMAAVRFNVGNKTNIVLNAGPYLAYGVGGKVKFTGKFEGTKGEILFNTFGKINKVTLKSGGVSVEVPIEELIDEIIDLDDYDISDMEGLHRFDLGLGTGIAVEYQNFIFSLDAQIGLTKLQTDSGRNLNTSISVGYKF